MLRRYILLRHPKARLGELGSRSGRRVLRLDEIEVRSGEQVPSRTTDETIIASAPVVPTSLIKPIARANEPVEDGTWGLDAIGVNRSRLDGSGVDVAILDTGIDSAHEAFSHCDVVERSFVDPGILGDPHGHGTHCAGILFGQTVSGSRIGVAPGVRRALVGTVLDASGIGSTSSLLHGLNWASEQGASVVSVSIGLDFSAVVDQLLAEGYPAPVATSAAVVAYVRCLRQLEAAASFYAEGGQAGAQMLMVAAVGNDSLRSVDPRFVVDASPVAASPQVVAVGAVRKSQSAKAFSLADFSNNGSDLCAPGVDIVSAKPGGGMTIMSGTSMATPFVAGVAALWTQRAGIALQSVSEIRARLIGTARRDPDLLTGEPDGLGAGIVVAPTTREDPT